MDRNIWSHIYEAGYDLYREGRDAFAITFGRHGARKATDTAITYGARRAWREMIAEHATGGHPALSGETKAALGLAAGGLLAVVGGLQRANRSALLQNYNGLQNGIDMVSTALAVGGVALASQTIWGSAPEGGAGGSGDINVPVADPQKKREQDIQVLREAAENATDEATRDQYNRWADQMERQGNVEQSGGGYVKPPADMQEYLQQLREFDVNDTE